MKYCNYFRRFNCNLELIPNCWRCNTESMLANIELSLRNNAVCRRFTPSRTSGPSTAWINKVDIYQRHTIEGNKWPMIESPLFPVYLWSVIFRLRVRSKRVIESNTLINNRGRKQSPCATPSRISKSLALCRRPLTGILTCPYIDMLTSTSFRNRKDHL